VSPTDVRRLSRALLHFQVALAVQLVIGCAAAFEVPGCRWACAGWWLVLSAAAARALWLCP